MAILKFDEFLKKAGGTKDDVQIYSSETSQIINQRQSPFERVLGAGEKVASMLGFGGAVDVLGSDIARATVPEEQKQEIRKPTIPEQIGAGLQIGATLIPGAVGAGLARNIALGAATGYLYDVGEGLTGGEGVKALIPGAGTITGAVVPPAIKGIGVAIKPLLKRGAKAVTQAGETIADVAPGAIQTGKEVLERIPRFAGRIKEGITEAAERAAKIKVAEPIVQTAIKSGLDERIINTINQADASTVKAYKEIIDIAENPSKTLTPKQRPEIVAGRAAGEQYGFIEKQRKAVGAKIGEAVDRLSKTEIVPMQKTFAELDNILIENGITPIKGKLKFAGKFTPSERTKIQQLYTLARESGKKMTPRQIYNMDQLFSKLQRETRIEGLGDILIDIGEGEKSSLFRVFRDVFTNTLDEVSPENIRTLNRAYRNIMTLQDDIENSIIKAGNFETTKGIDPAEFAQTNLRRILSDAQSAAIYKEILNEMDAVARKLGYAGPRADDLIAFATEMRKLYPDIIPPTSFTGGIKTGVIDLAKGVMEAGKPNLKDQQKALRELINSLLGE